MAQFVKLWAIKIWNGYKSVSLEIATFLFMSSVLMTYLTMQDLIIGRVCHVNLNYPKEVCRDVIENNGNFTEEESNIQKVMAQIRRTRSLLDYSIPIIFVLFQGSWSDIYGRKLPLILPCIGFILQALSLFMSLYMENWGGYTVVLISTIPKCISGSDVTFRMAALSYVSDVTTKQSRTVRTGLLSAAITLGVPIGFALGGAAMKASIPVEYVFLFSAGICATALLHILIFIDNKAKVTEENDNGNTANNETEVRKCFSLSNINSVFKSLSLSFKGVDFYTRIQIFALIIVIICINAPIQGEFGVMYLYLRKKLMWDSGDYGIFSTYISLVGVLGTLMSMGLLCTILSFSDPAIGFIAGISQFAGSFMYAFAVNNTMIYLAPTIDMLNGTMAVVAKSMLSKFCSPENFGKMFSLLAVIELLVPLLFDPIYSTVYEHTLDSFPGMVFILSAVMTVPPQITYAFYLWRNKKAASCDITESDSDIAPENNYKANIIGENHTAFKSDSGDIYNPTFDDKEDPPLKMASSTTTIASVLPTV